MSQHARPVGPTSVNDAAPVTSSMYAGYQPDTPYRPRSGRFHDGWIGVPPDVLPSSTEMMGNDRPTQPRLFSGPRTSGWIGIAPDQPIPFAVESVYGSHPDTNRAFPPRKGPSFFPWSGTPAPFSPEMTAGVHSDINRAFPPKNTGWTTLPFVDLFGPEMVVGWHPDRARFFTGPRPLGWQSTSHITQIDAPFSPEMIAGWHPDRPRLFKARDPHLPNVVQIDVFQFESIYGWKPDQPRLFSTRNKQGWTSSQTTHVNAPFGSEMVAGSGTVAFKWARSERWKWSPEQSWISDIVPPPVPHTPTRTAFVSWNVEGLTMQSWTGELLTFTSYAAPHVLVSWNAETRTITTWNLETNTVTTYTSS